MLEVLVDNTTRKTMVNTRYMVSIGEGPGDHATIRLEGGHALEVGMTSTELIQTILRQADYIEAFNLGKGKMTLESAMDNYFTPISEASGNAASFVVGTIKKEH